MEVTYTRPDKSQNPEPGACLSARVRYISSPRVICSIVNFFIMAPSSPFCGSRISSSFPMSRPACHTFRETLATKYPTTIYTLQSHPLGSEEFSLPIPAQREDTSNRRFRKVDGQCCNDINPWFVFAVNLGPFQGLGINR